MSVEQGAVVCNTGVPGKVYEWNHFDPIKDIPNGVYLTGFYTVAKSSYRVHTETSRRANGGIQECKNLTFFVEHY